MPCFLYVQSAPVATPTVALATCGCRFAATACNGCAAAANSSGHQHSAAAVWHGGRYDLHSGVNMARAAPGKQRHCSIPVTQLRGVAQ